MLYENKKDLLENYESSVPSQEIYRSSLQADCKNCFGLCCVALYFSASEGFPVDKEAGQPCPNLQSDYCCGVHSTLRELGLKGCSSFDCFGAGPKVARVTFGGQDWRQLPFSANQMFEVFQIMRQLHELLWYLTQSQTLQATRPIHDALRAMLDETERLTHLSPDELIELNLQAHRAEVNALLVQTSELVRAQVRCEQTPSAKRAKRIGPRADLIGVDLRRTELKGANLRGALLIAADLRDVDLSGTDLIGADFRDADIRGANLTESIFLTQAQLNVAKGDSNTKLPCTLSQPTYWPL